MIDGIRKLLIQLLLFFLCPCYLRTIPLITFWWWRSIACSCLATANMYVTSCCVTGAFWNEIDTCWYIAVIMPQLKDVPRFDIGSVRSQIFTCCDSQAVVTYAKLWSDQGIICHVRTFEFWWYLDCELSYCLWNGPALQGQLYDPISAYCGEKNKQTTTTKTQGYCKETLYPAQFI